MKDLSKFISVTHRRLQVHYSELMKKLGITSGQYIYVICVYEHPGLTQDEISQLMIINKSTVTKMLSQLELAGFITRKGNPGDKRSYHIFPTDKASAIYPEIIKIKEEWHHKMTEGLTDIERDVWEKIMEKVMENSIKNCKYM